jgi:ubiquinol-cytochrome c reductase iron-sulfur subunit
MPDEPTTGPGQAPEDERQHLGTRFLIGVALLATAAGGVGFAWSYVARAGNGWLGGFLALGFLGIGVALAAWGRDLSNDRPAADVYDIPDGDEEAQEHLTEDILSGVRVVTRRKFLALLLAGGAGVFAISQVVLAGSLGPRVRNRLFHTQWKSGSRLVAFDGRPVTKDSLTDGGFIVAFPEGHTDAADSQVVLMRLPGNVFTPQPGRESWSPEGFVAYSRVCTHAGCPVAQYEDVAQVLVCPCHQSTFDVLHGAEPVAGPAGRPLPQLPLAIDADGFLVAQSDFTVSVGPGFWDAT